MEIKHFTPYIRVAMYDIQNQDFRFDRVIWDYEIIYLLEGKMKVTVKDETTICYPNDIIILKPGEHHVLESMGEKVIQPHIHFDFFEDDISNKIFIPFVKADKMIGEQLTWFRKDVYDDLKIDLPTVIRINNSLHIKDLILKIIDEFNFRPYWYNFMIQGLFIEMFSEIVRSCNAKDAAKTYGKHLDDLDKIVEYINKNIDKNLTIDDLANYSNISKFYLSRLFKSIYKISPHKYISQMRLKKAKE